MSKLGATLKNKRETLGLDIDKVTEETRISADIIDVLERGEYKSMPSYNHAKNFVKNYASYLKLELDKVQELFDQECIKEDFNREVKYVTAPITKEKGASPSGAKFIIPVIILAVVAFAGFKVYTAMMKGKELGASEKTKTEEVSPVIEQKAEPPVDQQEVKEVIESINKEAEKTEAAKPEVKPEAKPEQKPAVKAEPKPEVKKEAAHKEEVKKEDAALSAFLPDKKDEPMAAAKTATVIFSDVCWVHIKVDDSEEMDFIAEKGNEREIVFHNDFVMDIGNAAVVSISYNNRTIAGLGAYKQPIKGLRFTVDENDKLKYSSAK